MPKKKRLILIRKYFQGGHGKYYAYVPRSVRGKDWSWIMDWVGEHTTGGHNYGWQVYISESKRKSRPPRKMMLKIPVYNLVGKK